MTKYYWNSDPMHDNAPNCFFMLIWKVAQTTKTYVIEETGIQKFDAEC